MGRGATTDFSSFMSVILMLIGVLVIMLVSNVLTIISNPENIKITSLVTSSVYAEEKSDDKGMSPFPFGNKVKEPSYIDVYRDRLVLYDPLAMGEIISLRDLEQAGNGFEKMLARVETNKVNDYIVLLARPRSATVVRRLKKVIRDRGVDVGVELYEANRDVEYERAARASGRVKDGEKGSGN